MIKIYRHEDKFSHVVFKFGKSWISIDRSGVMGWNNFKKRNFFFIYSTILNKNSAF